MSIYIGGIFVMKIGQFINRLNTTKDTVRHYENMNLLKPTKQTYQKEYNEKDIKNFKLIKELQNYGLSLKDIQLIFELKNTYQCGDIELIKKTVDTLTSHLEQLKKEEEDIHKRRILLEQELKDLQEYIRLEGRH